MDCRWWVSWIVAVGCAVDDGEVEGESSTGIAGTTSGSSASSVSTIPPDTTTEAVSSSSESSSESSSGAAQESSSGDCDCEMRSIAVDEVTPFGFSFEELLEAVGSPAEVPWVWTSIDGQLTTMARFRFEILGAADLAHDAACPDSPCNYVGGGVRVLVESDDGLLAEDFEGGVSGLLGQSASFDVAANAFKQFMGTLPQQMFVDADGDPMMVENAGIGGDWTWAGDTVSSSFFVYTPQIDADALILGESTE